MASKPNPPSSPDKAVLLSCVLTCSHGHSILLSYMVLITQAWDLHFFPFLSLHSPISNWSPSPVGSASENCLTSVFLSSSCCPIPELLLCLLSRCYRLPTNLPAYDLPSLHSDPTITKYGIDHVPFLLKSFWWFSIVWSRVPYGWLSWHHNYLRKYILGIGEELNNFSSRPSPMVPSSGNFMQWRIFISPTKFNSMDLILIQWIYLLLEGNTSLANKV